MRDIKHDKYSVLENKETTEIVLFFVDRFVALYAWSAILKNASNCSTLIASLQIAVLGGAGRKLWARDVSLRVHAMVKSICNKNSYFRGKADISLWKLEITQGETYHIQEDRRKEGPIVLQLIKINDEQTFNSSFSAW